MARVVKSMKLKETFEISWSRLFLVSDDHQSPLQKRERNGAESCKNGNLAKVAKLHTNP